MLLSHFKKSIHWLLPSTCLLCKTLLHLNEKNICEKCYRDLPILTNSCSRCAISLFSSFLLPKDSLCGHCLKNPPFFDAAHALFSYEEPVVKLILELKFNHKLTHAKLFGNLLADKILSDWYALKPLPDLILPLPLHHARLQLRGFNQALEIARYIAKKCNLPLDKKSALRIKATLPQARLNVPERKKNVANAFHILQDFQGQHIAIVDDVMTTGFTINAFSQALKKRGAKQIDVWCCARPNYYLGK